MPGGSSFCAKARRTRNEGRVRALKSLREAYARRRNRQGTAGLEIQQGDNSGKGVIEAEHLRYAIDGLPLLRDFSITLLRGDRVLGERVVPIELGG